MNPIRIVGERRRENARRNCDQLHWQPVDGSEGVKALLRRIDELDQSLAGLTLDYEQLRATCSLMHTALVEAKGRDFVRNLYEQATPK